MDVRFETRRLYVAPRKSVLFFAVVGERRLRCYVHETALVEPENLPRDGEAPYQHCLSAYDREKDLIQAAARRLIEANITARDGAVIISSAVLALEDAAKLPSNA